MQKIYKIIPWHTSKLTLKKAFQIDLSRYIFNIKIKSKDLLQNKFPNKILQKHHTTFTTKKPEKSP